MKKKLFYFRHGETEWNRLGRFQGHSDIPLNATGIEQAQRLRTFLDRCEPEVILSSDLQRAKQTARIANGSGQRPHFIDPRLREVFLGAAEGKTQVEVEALWGTQALRDWIDSRVDLNHFSFPGGETKQECIDRVKNFLEITLSELPYQCLALCGHGGTLKRFCASISKDKIREFPIPNCCVYEIHFNVEDQSWSEPQLVWQ